MTDPTPTTHETVHATFTLERTYPADPSRVFAAWADPATKARWFAGADGSAAGHRLDLRPGGDEVNGGRSPQGHALTFTSHYHDVVAARRLVFSSELAVAGRVVTASVTTVEFVAEGEGTRLVLTQQGTFLDGHEDPAGRERGTADQLDALAAELRR